MIAEQWKKIGIQADIKEMERNLALKRRDANEAQIGVDVHWGTENMFSHPMVTLFPFDPTSQLGPPTAPGTPRGEPRGRSRRPGSRRR